MQKETERDTTNVKQTQALVSFLKSLVLLASDTSSLGWSRTTNVNVPSPENNLLNEEGFATSDVPNIAEPKREQVENIVTGEAAPSMDSDAS